MKSKFFIFKSDCTFPNAVVMEKLALIAVVVIWVIPTAVNFPNFFNVVGNFFPRISGSITIRLS